MTGAERNQLAEALERLHVIERRVEVMQVRQEHGQVAVESAQNDIKEIKQDVKMLVDRVADNRLEAYRTGGIAAAVSAIVAGVAQVLGGSR